jgi:cellobiose phosphorylase
VWLEEVLGVRLRGDRLTIQPRLPEDWPGYTLTLCFGETEYRIEVENGSAGLGEEILLKDDRESHTIRIAAGGRILV